MKEKIIKIIHKYGDIIYHLFNMVNQIKPERSNWKKVTPDIVLNVY